MDRLLPHVPTAIAVAYLGTLNSPVNDKFQFWFAGHLVASGRSPYDHLAWTETGIYGPTAVLITRSCVDGTQATCVWPYPPWVGWLFAPFGLMDVQAGIIAQSVFLLLATAIGIMLLADEARLSGPATVAFGLGAALSAPLVWNTFLGHFAGLELIGAAAAARSLRTGRALPMVVAAILLSFKPHLSLLVPPLIVAALVRARAARVVAVTAAVMSALFLVNAVADARMIGTLSGVPAKLSPTLPTTWALARWAAPNDTIAVAVAALIVAGCAIAAWVALRAVPSRAEPLTVVAVAMASSLVVAPYAHLYDYVCLFPALAATIALVDSKGPGRPAGYAVIAAFCAVTWYAFLLGPHGDEPVGAALIPILTLLTLALFCWLPGRPGPTPARAAP